VSFVFYIPESDELKDDDTLKNSTVLYDKNLNPCYKAKYIPNSVCIFAPHFYSYHGFDTTIERTALVMFYINEKLFDEYAENVAKIHRKLGFDRKFLSFKTNICDKLTKFPLLEYRDKSITDEMRNCKINGENGRVF